jgi:putative adhesin
MKRLHTSLVFVAMLAAAAVASAQTSTQDTGERITASFSDASRPGLLHVALITGSITVKASQGKDVIIQARGRDDHASRGREGPGDGDSDAPVGLKRLRQQPSLSVEERNNRMEIIAPSGLLAVDLEIQVPAHTNLQLSTVNNGNVTVEGIDGEMEIANVNGSITLQAVSGAVVAHTVNGKVLADLTRITAQKPMAFTSLNGVVDVTLPAAVKANLKLRTDNGNVFTDFELKMLSQSAPTVEDTRRTGGRYRVEVNRLIYGSVNGGGPDFEMRTFNGNIYVRKGT